MFDNHNCVAALAEPSEYIHKSVHISKMKSRGWLIKHIYRLSRSSSRKLCCKLDSLRLSARQSGGWLTQLDISESHIAESLYLLQYPWHICKELACLVNCHVKDFIDTLALVLDLQSLPVISLSSAHFTWHIYIWQEVHLYLDYSISTTRLASSTRYIEAESSLAVTSCLGILGSSKQIPYQIKCTCISSRIGSRRSTYR